MQTRAQRIAEQIVEQRIEAGVLYTVFKPGPVPKPATGGRRMPVFAVPVSRYRNG